MEYLLNERNLQSDFNIRFKNKRYEQSKIRTNVVRKVFDVFRERNKKYYALLIDKMEKHLNRIFIDTYFDKKETYITNYSGYEIAVPVLRLELRKGEVPINLDWIKCFIHQETYRKNHSKYKNERMEMIKEDFYSCTIMVKMIDKDPHQVSRLTKINGKKLQKTIKEEVLNTIEFFNKKV